ncbi:MAG: phospholipid carrier-dependent glycosyltransferase [Chloroflexi bacterium]|nr:MAG: phospholipid carrier-dependent glycosyltransferase [Chloroflexota bacterium]
MKRWTKSDWLILLGVLVVAGFFRLWQLHAIPPGFQFDEAYNAADALRVSAGERPLFFEANGGREALHIYWIAPFVAALGANAFALRLASAVVGSTSVALSYVLWRELIQDRTVAALASLLMAISYWHVHFSRYGIRAILMPLMLTLTLYCLWRATMTGERREWVIARAAKNWRVSASPHWLFAILCGVLLGLSLYAHPAARFVPVIVVAWFVWQWWQVWKHSGLSLLVIALVALVVFMPLGLYFLNNPQAFLGHPTVVAITDQRVGEGSVLAAFGANTLRVLGMFFVSGDTAWIHNLSGRPVFDLIVAAFFVIGLVVWAKRIRQGEPAAILILLWLPIMLLPTLLSDGAPNFSRAIGVMPALFVIPALGMAQAIGFVARGLPQLRYALPAAALLASALFTFDDYFVRFASAPETFVAYDVDKLEAAQQARALAQSDRVYVAPLLAQHATFALATGDAGLKSFDNGEVVVLPARDEQRGMTYLFPVSVDPGYMDWFEHTYGTLAHRQVVDDSRGNVLLYAYRIAAQDIPADARLLPPALPVAPQKIVNVRFDNAIELVGYRIAAPQSSEQPYQLTLIWQARQSVTQDYTLFIHLDDASGARIAQRDRRPGNGSYPTTVWSPGDSVIETYELAIRDKSARLQFAVGWYLVGDGARAHVLDAQNIPIDDQFRFSAEGTP